MNIAIMGAGNVGAMGQGSIGLFAKDKSPSSVVAW